MSARLVECCGLCGGDRLEQVLNVGSSPPTCAMLPIGARTVEHHYPLEVLLCADCGLAQLSVIVDPAETFATDYPYSSGNSKALHANFSELAREATRWANGLDARDLVVDIGANDGTLLSKFEGCRTIGIEPTGQVERIGGPSYREFFTEALAERIVAQHGKASVVTACNVLAHVEDVGDVMRGINVLLADDGLLVAENHDLASVVDGQWDTIYHEHLRFYSPRSFHKLLEAHGLGGRLWKTISTHGGSFRVLAARGECGWPPSTRDYDFRGLARQMAHARRALRKATRRGVYGIGATARATTVINYCGLDVEDIQCVCEVAESDKIGHYIPGTRIPVVDEARLIEDQPKSLLFSWYLADAIVPQLRKRGYRGDVIVPLPTPRCL